MLTKILSLCKKAAAWLWMKKNSKKIMFLTDSLVGYMPILIIHLSFGGQLLITLPKPRVKDEKEGEQSSARVTDIDNTRMFAAF